MNDKTTWEWMRGPLLLPTINGWWRALLSIIQQVKSKREVRAVGYTTGAGLVKVLGSKQAKPKRDTQFFECAAVLRGHFSVFQSLSSHRDHFERSHRQRESMFFLRRERSFVYLWYLLPKHIWDFLPSHCPLGRTDGSFESSRLGGNRPKVSQASYRCQLDLLLCR